MSVHFALLTLYLAAMHSTSTNAPLGNAFTATAERAGKGCAKNSAYMHLSVHPEEESQLLPN